MTLMRWKPFGDLVSNPIREKHSGRIIPISQL